MRLFTLVALGVAFALTANAQDDADDNHTVQIVIPEVAILDLEASAGTSITLSVVAPTEAGLAVSFATAVDSTVWINYSSIVGSTTEASRTVSARISAGTLPGGMVLKVTAAADAGNGAGTVGTSAGQITLSGSNQTVISAIGSCYTGDGASNGHALYYALEQSGSYGDIDFDDATTLTVLYTVSDS